MDGNKQELIEDINSMKSSLEYLNKKDMLYYGRGTTQEKNQIDMVVSNRQIAISNLLMAKAQIIATAETLNHFSSEFDEFKKSATNKNK